MAVTPKGPTEYPLGGLTPDQFEALVFLLARDEFPEVVRIRAKDRGLDARRPDPSGATLRGWQAKRFTGDIKWDQCEESVRRALAFWRPPRLTFAFPKVLSAKEQDDFRTRLIEKFPHLNLDWWDDEELQARMRDTEGGRRAAAWLFDNLEETEERMRRAIAVGGELADAHQAAERVAEVQSFVDRDPHLRYTIVSADVDAPPTPPAAETIISFEAQFGSKRVRFSCETQFARESTPSSADRHHTRAIASREGFLRSFSLRSRSLSMSGIASPTPSSSSSSTAMPRRLAFAGAPLYRSSSTRNASARSTPSSMPRFGLARRPCQNLPSRLESWSNASLARLPLVPTLPSPHRQGSPAD